jgi:DNA-binding NarL/FixJ family response regulator
MASTPTITTQERAILLAFGRRTDLGVIADQQQLSRDRVWQTLSRLCDLNASYARTLATAPVAPVKAARPAAVASPKRTRATVTVVAVEPEPVEDIDDDIPTEIEGRVLEALPAGVDHIGLPSHLDVPRSIAYAALETVYGKLGVRSPGDAVAEARERGYLPMAVDEPEVIESEVSELSPRQRGILQLLVDGHDRPEIARRLDTTVAAIKGQTHEIYVALNVKSIKSAVEAAAALGIEPAAPEPPVWPADLSTQPEPTVELESVEPDFAPEPAAAEPEPMDLEIQAKRHQQILDYLADGYTTDDIAAELGLGDDDIRAELRALYRTLAAGSRPALTIATRIGIDDASTVIAEYRGVHCAEHRWTGIAGEHQCATRPVRVQILGSVA